MLHIALIFGGESPEHEVSIVSARYLRQQLEAGGYRVTPVGIARNGKWIVGEQAFDQLCGSEDEIGDPASVKNGPGLGAHASALKALADLAPDLVFPIVHGVTGEDGTLLGYCRTLNLATIGGGMLNLSLTWDKLTTRFMLMGQGIPQVPFVVLEREEGSGDQVLDRIEAALTYPIFVKPSRTGSSIGITRARDRLSLKRGIEEAFLYDYRVLAEQGFQVREIEVAAIGGREPFISVPGEIVPENEFYDFEEKYLKDTTQFLVPARLDPSRTGRVEDYARRAWRLLDCYAMARIDFLVTEDEVYLNEINTFPGFTGISMYPKLLAASGIAPVDQMHRLVELALDRHRARGRKQAFSSHRDWYKAASS